MTTIAKKPEAEAQALAEAYEPTARELATAKAFVAQDKKISPTQTVKITQGNSGLKIEPDHPEPGYRELLLMGTLATTDPSFQNGILGQLFNAGTQGQTTDARGVNFMLSVIKGFEPNDQLETMLAAQMAAVHVATMTFARRLAHVENIPQQDAAEKAFNKLARTFTTQMAALMQYRTGGQQKMTVEHVHVHDGGQAIVGNVQGGGGSEKKGSQPHETGIRLPKSPALHGDIEADPQAVPGTRRPWLGRLPLPRRAGRRSQGSGQWCLPPWSVYGQSGRGAAPAARIAGSGP